MRGNKFRNIPTVANGIRFASKAEAKRYHELLLLEKAGEIVGLELQKRYQLNASDGSKVAVYVADFDYIDKRTNTRVTEDVKSPATVKLTSFRIKRGLFRAQFGRDITVVMK